MAIFTLDHFNGTPDAYVVQGRTGDVGAQWIWGAGLAGSTAQIDSTGARIRSNNVNANSYFFASGVANADGSYCEIEYDVGTSAVDSFGPAVRASKTQGYFVLVGTSSFTIRRLNNTTFTTVTTDNGSSTIPFVQTPNTSHVIRITATGLGDSVVVQVHIDGALKATFTDTSTSRILTLGSVGFTCYGRYNSTTGFFLKSIVGGAPAPAATTFNVYGPTRTTRDLRSTEFTSIANGDTTAMVTASDNGNGGTFFPSATFRADGGSCTYVGSKTGTVTLSFTNNGGLTNATSRDITVTALPVGYIDTQHPPSGQRQQFVGSASDAQTGEYSITNAITNETIGPISFEVVDGKFDFTHIGLEPGSYVPTLTVSGIGGKSTVSGTTGFSILGVYGTSQFSYLRALGLVSLPSK